MDSPFTPHIDTNYVPTEEESVLIKHLIENKKGTADTLATEIAQTEAALAAVPLKEREAVVAAMKAQRSSLSKFIEDHAKLLSPVRRIPQEVLSIIFLYSAEDVRDLGMNEFWCYRVSRWNVPVILSHVSREWRCVALETPRLWSRLVVVIPGIDVHANIGKGYEKWAENMERKKRRILTYTQRSSHCPITLKLENAPIDAVLSHDEYYHDLASELYRSLVDIICQSSSRWQDVEFTLTFDPITQCLVRLFERSPGDLALLRSLTIDLHLDRFPQPSTLTVDCVKQMTLGTIFGATLLRSVSIKNGVWGDIGAAKVSLAVPTWEGITHLYFNAKIAGEISSFGTHHALKVLRALPNLVECELKLAHRPGAFPHPVEVPPISLPNLAKLTLTSFPPSRGFAESLDLPNLQALHLRSENVVPTLSPQGEDANGIVELLRRFGHQLEEITLYYETLARPSIPRCLELLSSVTHLELLSIAVEHPMPHSTETTAAALSQLGDHQACPKLQFLHIHVRNSGEGGMGKALVNCLTQRRGSGATDAPSTPLRHVRASFRGLPPTFDVIQQLHQLDVDLYDFGV